MDHDADEHQIEDVDRRVVDATTRAARPTDGAATEGALTAKGGRNELTGTGFQAVPKPTAVTASAHDRPVQVIRHLAARLSDRVPAGSFLRHVFAISSGVAFAQLISVAASPIISRIYAPSVFGTVATLSALAAIGATLATFRFEVAIPIAIDDIEALALTSLTLACASVCAIVVTIGLIVLPADILGKIGLPAEVMDLRLLVPVMMLASTFQSVVTEYGTYRRSYSALATAQVLQSSVSSGLRIGLGLIAPEAICLAIGDLARRVLGIGMIARKSGLELRGVLQEWRGGHLRAIANSHRRYPLFVLPSSLLNTISLQAPVAILALHFSTSASGLYALGLAVVQMPLSLISSAVQNAFVGRIRDYERAERLPEVMTKMVRALAVIGAPWFALLVAWGPDLMRIVFGDRWRDSGTYLSFLAPWLFVSFVFSACNMVLWAKNRQGADFGWQILFVTTRIGALELGAQTGDPIVAVAAFGVVSFLALAGYYVWLLRFAGVGLVGSVGFAARELAGYCAVTLVIRYGLAELEVPALLEVGVGIVAVGLVALWRLRASRVFRSMHVG